ncbi:MAG: isoprenylcysteine carboxylmethyltransferase family protein [Pirellulales bacterium]
MSPESAFRIALFATLVLTMGVVVYHRVQAHSSERFDRREEGVALAVTLRLAGLALWLFTLAYLIRPEWMQWAALPLADGVRWAGAAVGLLCAALMYWTLASLGKNLTDTVATRGGATLVTDGPYRLVRHPFYVVAGLLMLSVTLLTASAAIGAASLLVLTLLILRTPNEERRLLETFGEPYRKYRARTGAFFPKWPSRRE